MIPDKKQRKFYLNFIGFRIGIWHSYSEDTVLHLSRTSQHSRAGWGKWGTSGYVSYYYIFMVNEREEVELNVFDDYVKAKTWMQQHAELLQMKAIDKFWMEVEESRSGRKNDKY